MVESLKLYHAPASPNSRRVRIFLAEKEVCVPLVSVDLAAGEQHRDAYLAINPRRVVPTLVLEDGTAIGEVLAIWRYIEEVRVANFYGDMDAWLAEAPFVAGELFSAADITSFVTVDFATRAFDMPISTEMCALKRWYDVVAARSSATA
jgi:glutathione S-transferase